MPNESHIELGRLIRKSTSTLTNLLASIKATNPNDTCHGFDYLYELITNNKIINGFENIDGMPLKTKVSYQLFVIFSIHPLLNTHFREIEAASLSNPMVKAAAKDYVTVMQNMQKYYPMDKSKRSCKFVIEKKTCSRFFEGMDTFFGNIQSLSSSIMPNENHWHDINRGSFYGITYGFIQGITDIIDANLGKNNMTKIWSCITLFLFELSNNTDDVPLLENTIAAVNTLSLLYLIEETSGILNQGIKRLFIDNNRIPSSLKSIMSVGTQVIDYASLVYYSQKQGFYYTLSNIAAGMWTRDIVRDVGSHLLNKYINKSPSIENQVKNSETDNENQGENNFTDNEENQGENNDTDTNDFTRQIAQLKIN